MIQGYGRDVFAAGLLALEDAGLDQHLLLPLHDEYVLALPADEAAALVDEIARLVARPARRRRASGRGERRRPCLVVALAEGT